jgi:hypothetical protein
MTGAASVLTNAAPRLSPVSFNRVCATPADSVWLQDALSQAIATLARQTKTPPGGGAIDSFGITGLLDLGFLELDVLLGDRIVFAERQLFRLGAAVLAGHVEEAGVGSRQKLDLDVCGFGHGVRPSVVVRFAPLEHGKNTRTRETWRDT